MIRKYKWVCLVAASMSAAAADSGRLVFEDTFSGVAPGEGWHSVLGDWAIEDGVLAGRENPADGHGAVTQTYLDFSDLVLEFRFRFAGSASFNVVIDDRHYRGSHAGHICRVVVGKGKLRLGDDKTGIMENGIFAMRRDPQRKNDAQRLLAGKQKEFPAELGDGAWHTLRIAVVGDTLSAVLDGREAGSLRSPGIGHRTKTDFGFTVPGAGVQIDDVRAWLPVSSGPAWIYGAGREMVAARFDAGTASLEVVQREPLDLAAGPVCYHPDHGLVYVADTRAAADGGARGIVFRAGPDGRLGAGTAVEFHHGYAYLALDRTRRFLLAASYREGHVDVYALDERGIPGKRVATRFEGRDKAHAVLVSPDNRFAYVPYVKDRNALHQYRFDGKTGGMTPLAPPRIDPPQASGPRHLAFHPSRPLVFFSNEQHLGASSYRIGKNGQLTPLGLCDVFEDVPGDGQSASDVVLTRGGRFLFTGLRGRTGGVNAVCRYAVGDDGKLAFLGRTPADEIPWGMHLSPDERHLFVSATRAGTLTAYAIGKEAALTRAATIEWGENIRDLVAVPVP